ncbi:MAG: NUDIX hydrolase [Actinophytocola sp.]|uniref:NUDIX domain-containing protein n=1 Tax=Actinophytocola sp. TaxID=1872138 RepID=UPI003C726BBE
MAELHLLPYDEYVAQLPRKSVSAGVLIRDDHGRVLLVEPSYKAGWEIPGGVVEDGEAPWTTAVREVHEEIGLVRPRGRLLLIDHVPADNDTLPERLAFIFDGGSIDPSDVGRLVLSAEIAAAELCDLRTMLERVKPILAARLGAAIKAAEAGVTAMCERGQEV